MKPNKRFNRPASKGESIALSWARRYAKNMKTSLMIIPVFIVFWTLGCSSTERINRTYSSSQIGIPTVRPTKYVVEPGGKVVLVKSAYTISRPIMPHLIGGFSLFIELEPGALQPGEHVLIPSDRAKAFLSRLRAPSRENFSDVEGFLEVQKLDAKGVHGFLDLHSTEAQWEFKGKEFFKNAPISCVGMTDKCLRETK